jgi:signal transduction histidine kinase
MYLLAASGQLALAVLALTRSRTSPVAKPLAFLGVDMFAWCFATVAGHLTGADVWSFLDAGCTALAPALVLHTVVTFVGAERAYARVLALAYVAFGGLALSSVAGLVAPWGRAWVDAAAWSHTFLAMWLPTLVLVLVILVRHLVHASDADEKARTRTMLAALAMGGALATADELRVLPHAASLGTLIAAFLVATATLRFRLLDRDFSRSTAVYTGTLSVAGVVTYVALFHAFGGHVAALVIGSATVTLVLGAAVHEVVVSLVRQREGRERLATLGRFSQQLAHDLKNPLATLKGALQFLEEERARGQSLDEHVDFLGVMLEQIDRLHRVVDDYQRIGRVEPLRRSVDVNELVRGVVALAQVGTAEGIALRTELADDVPRCELDGDLVSGALENMMQNALEAMPRGGTLVVRTERSSGPAPGVTISVADDGAGMDARQATHAFDDFYTTKPHGSGLGLAFVRRVAHAHGGDVSLSSKVGVGTIVRLRVPAE